MSELSAEYEWAVMHPLYPEEPHRGPWAEDEVRAWVKAAEADGFKTGAFYVARRTVGQWTQIDGYATEREMQ